MKFVAIQCSGLIIISLTLQYCLFSFGAVVHKSHHHGAHDHNSLNQERESDGAYSPNDHVHYEESANRHNQFEHEAILGSAKEAEEYDHLPPEEAKKHLAILLEKMDTSKDGFIDRSELKAWIIRSFRMLSKEEANERLNDADENHDGKVSWTEYLSDTYGVDSNEDDSLRFHEENLHLISEDKEMWEAADRDHDGLLNSTEFQAFSNPEEDPDMVMLVLNQTLNNKDTDKDGSISFQEYIGERGVELNKENLLAEKHKFDEEYDKDQDGKLSGQEILSWIVPSNEEIAEDEVIHLFAHSDDDHNDLLSFDEILDHYETFVGSEVTDYGDHLHNLHQFDDEL
ncbi:reticulocalbin-2 [Euwallacea similis]|uniref:reticulocalbin-2 n=1 Tax=Euwallacea similis TaxID=1736056 RepID=UPI00344C66CF